MSREYRFVVGDPSAIPCWGSEVSMMNIDNQDRGDTQRMVITTSKFDKSESFPTGQLIGNRSIWYIDNVIKKAQIQVVQSWVAEIGAKWISQGDRKVPTIHRRIASQILMEKWDMGKLRGRIEYQ